MFDVDNAVQQQMNELIGKMRARRLSGELPVPSEALPPPEAGEGDQGPDESSDMQALESMLEGE